MSMAHRSLRTPLVRSCWQALDQLFADKYTILAPGTGSFRSHSSGCTTAGFAQVRFAFASQAVVHHQLQGCCLQSQRRAFAIRRQRRREEPRKPEIPALPNAVDWDIDSDQVMVAHDDNTSVMSLSQAVTMAHSRNLNLVQVSLQKSQPVCRLLDFREMQRAHREGHEKKHAEDAEKEKRLAKMKGVRLRYVTC